MKKSKKLLLLGISAGLVPLAAPILSLSSCKIVPAYEKNEYVVAYNAPKTLAAFSYDPSRSYGGYQPLDYNNYIGGEFVRKQPLNSIEIEKVIKSGANEFKVVKPVFVRYKLELLKALVVTDKDGTVAVFDNDNYDEQLPEPDVTDSETGKKYYSKPIYDLKSSDSKSLNSDNFVQKLQSANKIQFVIKEGVYYVDSKGQKTKYQVVPKDFYYSWLRTINITQGQRYSQGGNTKLDQAARKAFGSDTNSTLYSDTESYSNDYLYKVFGLNTDGFADESQMLQTVSGTGNNEFDGKVAVTFSGSPGKQPSFLSFFNNTFADGGYDFMPAPSQYIDEVNSSGKYPIYNIDGSKASATLTNELTTLINAMPKNKEAYKAGVYWYGSALNNTLFAGPYYPEMLKNQRQTLRKNSEYWDKEWVKSEDNLKSIIFEYQTKPLELKLFSDTTFNQYQQGTVSQLNYQGLTDAQKQTVVNNYEKFGLRYQYRLNKDTPFYERVSTPWISNSAQITEYGFNDAYAKMTYDKTIEELKAGKSTSDSWINGRGLSFRSMIMAAINWTTYANTISNDEREPWIAKIANGSNVGGSDQNTSPIKTPEDVYETINGLRAFDKDGVVINFPSLAGTDKTLITPSDNKAAASTQAEEIDKMKSAGFEVLKQKMAELIAEFDSQNPSLAGQTFEMAYYYPYSNPTKEDVKGYDAINAVLKQLNPRLDFTVKYFDGSNKEEKPKSYAWRYYGANGSALAGWKYDFNSIASGYDGLSWSSAFIPTLVKIGTLENSEMTKFETKFPEIAKLAKELISYQNSHPFNASVPFNEMYKIEPKLLVSLNALSQVLRLKMKMDSTTNKYVLADRVPVLDSNNQPVVDKEGHPVTRREPYNFNGKQPTDVYEWSAEFWINHYVPSKTNEELVKLMTEMTTFINTNYGVGVSKGKDKYATLLVNPHYVSKRIPGYSQIFLQDWLVVKELKK